MAKRCPPGVICIENITIIFLILVFCLAGFVWYKFGTTSNKKLRSKPKATLSPRDYPKYQKFYKIKV